MNSENDTSSGIDRAIKAGLPPGSLVHVGQKYEFNAYIEHIAYSADSAYRSEHQSPENCRSCVSETGVQWITLFGVHDAQAVEEIGKTFDLHPLLLEDVLNTTQRPNAELYGDKFFASLKMVYWDEGAKAVRHEHISIVLIANIVLLFQEKPGDIYNEVRKRIDSGKGIIRSKGADYLFYRLIDTVVDEYFIICDNLHKRIDRIEGDILKKPEQLQMMRLIQLKRQLLSLRNTIVPLRDHLTLMERLDRNVVKRETIPYLRDLTAHVKEVIEMLDLERESVSSLIDLHLSTSSQQLNHVMRVLTVIATIFIPLTFIVGIYGMNFDYMPELHYDWAYPAIWGVMIAVTGGLLLFFRKKGWI